MTDGTAEGRTGTDRRAAVDPRLSPMTADEWTEPAYAAFSFLLLVRPDQVPRAGSGHPHDPLKFDIVGLLARHPDLAEAFLKFNTFLLKKGRLPKRLREILVLRVAATTGSSFEWAEHVKIAANAGITPAEIAALARGNDTFTGSDRLVLEATDQLLVDSRIHPDTARQALDELGTELTMEIVFLVGTYSMLASMFLTAGLEAREGEATIPTR